MKYIKDNCTVQCTLWTDRCFMYSTVHTVDRPLLHVQYSAHCGQTTASCTVQCTLWTDRCFMYSIAHTVDRPLLHVQYSTHCGQTAASCTVQCTLWTDHCLVVIKICHWCCRRIQCDAKSSVLCSEQERLSGPCAEWQQKSAEIYQEIITTTGCTK